MGAFVEMPKKKVPVIAKKDVVVIGGGPAGINAAVAAARAGAETMLVEQYAFPGGNCTKYHGLYGFLDVNGNQIVKGIPDEIIERLKKVGASTDHMRNPLIVSFTVVDPEMFKIVVLQMLQEAGCEILLHSFFGEVLMDSGQIKAVVVHTKSGAQAIEGKVFIDTTGDADVAARAGAPFEKGRKSDGRMMPVQLVFLVGNVNWDRFKKAAVDNPDLYGTDGLVPSEYFLDKEHFVYFGQYNLAQLAIKQGYKVGWNRPAYMTMLQPDQSQGGLTRVDDIDGTDVESLTRGEIEARLQIPEQMRFLHDYVPGFESCRLVAVAHEVGVRETRQIVGDYALTREDILKSRRFSDVVAVGGYMIDDEDELKTEFPQGNYDIPYRCLVPQKVQNLLVAGRCISAAREAMFSARCIATCMSLGQAAGCAGALCTKHRLTPRNLDVESVKDLLKDQGAYLGEANE